MTNLRFPPRAWGQGCENLCDGTLKEETMSMDAAGACINKVVARFSLGYAQPIIHVVDAAQHQAPVGTSMHWPNRITGRLGPPCQPTRSDIPPMIACPRTPASTCQPNAKGGHRWTSATRAARRWCNPAVVWNGRPSSNKLVNGICKIHNSTYAFSLRNTRLMQFAIWVHITLF